MLAIVLRSFRDAALPCDVFGGWAEELLGLRAPWSHGDIDLVYRRESLADFDAMGGDFERVTAKRFHHKRAFVFHGILCEIILVRNADIRPFTLYWGDVPFHWDQPFLHPDVLDICGEPATVVLAANLARHWRLHKETQPERSRDPTLSNPDRRAFQ